LLGTDDVIRPIRRKSAARRLSLALSAPLVAVAGEARGRVKVPVKITSASPPNWISPTRSNP
jgi:hypothetical protein